MVGKVVKLKPGQCYAGCLGAVMAEVPRDGRPGRMYEVYVDELGTLLRMGHDLEPIEEAKLESGAFEYIHPTLWKARADRAVAMKALIAAMAIGRDDEALEYATVVAEAEEVIDEMEAA